MQAAETTFNHVSNPHFEVALCSDNKTQNAENRLVRLLKELQTAIEDLKTSEDLSISTQKSLKAAQGTDLEIAKKMERTWQTAWHSSLKSLAANAGFLSVNLLQKRLLPLPLYQTIEVLSEPELEFTSSGLSLKETHEIEAHELLQLAVSYEALQQLAEAKKYYLKLAQKLHKLGYCHYAIKTLQIARKYSPVTLSEALLYITLLWERGCEYAGTNNYLNGLRDLEKAASLLEQQSQLLSKSELNKFAHLKSDLKILRAKNEIIQKQFKSTLQQISRQCLAKNEAAKQGIVFYGHVTKVEDWIEKCLFHDLEAVKITLVHSATHLADIEKLRRPLQDPSKFILFVLTPDFNRFILDKSPANYTAQASQLELTLFLNQLQKNRQTSSPVRSMHALLLGEDEENPWPISPNNPNTYDFREPKDYFDQVFKMIQNVQTIPQAKQVYFSEIVSKFHQSAMKVIEAPLSDEEASKILGGTENDAEEGSMMSLGVGMMELMQTFLTP